MLASSFENELRLSYLLMALIGHTGLKAQTHYLPSDKSQRAVGALRQPLEQGVANLHRIIARNELSDMVDLLKLGGPGGYLPRIHISLVMGSMVLMCQMHDRVLASRFRKHITDFRSQLNMRVVKVSDSRNDK